VSDPVLTAIRTRRVTRTMTSAPVDPRELDLVIGAARYAPNAGNRRLQPVLAVTEPRQLGLLRVIAPGMIARPQAAAVICIDVARAVEYGFRPDAPSLYVDVGTTAATMLLAAHAAGLASCPVTSFSRVAANRLLGLPDALTTQMIICLGRAGAHQPPVIGAPIS
jgi:nitroreductase